MHQVVPGQGRGLGQQRKAARVAVGIERQFASVKGSLQAVDQFVDRYKPDELMVTAQIHDHQARLKSYLLLMEAVRQPAASAA